MAQYIDKTVIENILHKLWKKDKGFGYTDTLIAYNKALQAVQYELDTIEEKEVDYRTIDKDFERDAVSFCIDNGLNTTPHIAKTIAKHFF